MKINKLTAMLAMSVLLTPCFAGCLTLTSDTSSDSDTGTTQQQTTTETKTAYDIGETWTVDGQWSLTVTGVTATDYRNPYSDKTPAAVYIVDFTYTNIGYLDSLGLFDGLYFSIDSMIVDNTGKMGYSYPGEITNYAQETPVGATCDAQECIGVDNAGSFKLTVTKYDGTSTKQQATFNVTVA